MRAGRVELDALVLEDKPLAAVPADGARAAMLAGVRELGIARCPGIEEARDAAGTHRDSCARSSPRPPRRGLAGRCPMPRCCRR